jgi:hypothetical protein
VFVLADNANTRLPKACLANAAEGRTRLAHLQAAHAHLNQLRL